MRRRRRDQPHPTSIRIPRKLLAKLEARAAAQGSFLSVYIIWLLQAEMDRLDRGERPLPQYEQQQ